MHRKHVGGDPAKNLAPWRDTGVEVRGPAVADVEAAFVQIWNLLGEPISIEDSISMHEPEVAGDMSVRIVATVPSTAGMIRTDQLIAALARKRLWLADAYYAGLLPTFRPCGLQQETMSMSAFWCPTARTCPSSDPCREADIVRCSKRASGCLSGMDR